MDPIISQYWAARHWNVSRRRLPLAKPGSAFLRRVVEQARKRPSTNLKAELLGPFFSRLVTSSRYSDLPIMFHKSLRYLSIPTTEESSAGSLQSGLCSRSFPQRAGQSGGRLTQAPVIVRSVLLVRLAVNVLGYQSLEPLSRPSSAPCSLINIYKERHTAPRKRDSVRTQHSLINPRPRRLPTPPAPLKSQGHLLRQALQVLPHPRRAHRRVPRWAPQQDQPPEEGSS